LQVTYSAELNTRRPKVLRGWHPAPFAQIVIHVGDTVEWRNPSSVPHTVTADARRAAYGKEVVLPPGAVPFDSAGSIWFSMSSVATSQSGLRA
jgi:plastocyanin